MPWQGPYAGPHGVCNSFELEWMREYEVDMKLSNVMEFTLRGELNNTSHLALDMVNNVRQ